MARRSNPPTRRSARCARSERLRRPAAVLERARGGELLVFGGRRPVADLRRQPHRQLRARLAVHARHVSRGFPIRNPRFLAKRAPRSGARSSGRICYRNDSFKKNLQGPGAPAAARYVCAGPDHSGRRALGVGPGRQARAAGARPGGRRHYCRQTVPAVRPCADLPRAGGADRAVLASLAHALGTRVRAATQDREMAAALGVNERRLFTAVFALGALLAGFGGASAIPREPASLQIDLAVMSDAFVVVVVGGLGSIPGAFLAALLIGELKAFCIGLGYSELTLAIEFIVMAVVLVLRPWGLLGRPQAETRGPGTLQPPLPAPSFLLLGGLAVLLAIVPVLAGPYTIVLLTDVLVFALFAASLHLLMGPGGMPSFGP